jgi:hypothetical protein
LLDTNRVICFEYLLEDSSNIGGIGF